MTPRLLETLTRRSSSLVWYISFSSFLDLTISLFSQHKNATENDLRREFEGFGSIERVRIVRDKNGRSRGYAFIVFERERDMKGN